MKIQWYPGHMTKAKRAMTEDMKIIDLVIEILDARAPIATRNPDIDKLARNKARIVVLNKTDLADDKISKLWVEYFYKEGIACICIDSRQKQFIKKLMPLIDKAVEEKRAKDLKKGIQNRPVRTMITGIPNVGKSTLINSIVGKSMAKTGNKPGVTKGNQWIRINKSVELLDTPGILWPKFDDEQIGEHLAFIGSINDMIIDNIELASEFIRFCIKKDINILKNRYEITDLDIESILSQIAAKRGCLKKGNEYDLDKSANLLIQEFRTGKLGKISLEEPRDIK